MDTRAVASPSSLVDMTPGTADWREEQVNKNAKTGTYEYVTGFMPLCNKKV